MIDPCLSGSHSKEFNLSSAPILHAVSEQWILGIIENGQTRPLTRDEVEGLAETLNGLEQTLIGLIRDLSPEKA